MATTKDTIKYLMECLDGLPVATRAMFGEYALYYMGKTVGLICDDQLHIKITPITDQYIDVSYNNPPYPGAKPWRIVPEEQWRDRAFMENLLKKTSHYVPERKKKV